MRSRRDAEARPVRTVANPDRACSTDLTILSWAPLISSSAVAIASALLLTCRDDRSDLLAVHDARDVALGELEDVDREAVVHAERQRCRVHYLQPTLDRLQVRDPRQELGVGDTPRVAVVHPLHAVLRHQDRVGAHLERAQRRRGVRREERVAGAGGEDHDSALLEMADRAPFYVWVGDLRDLERG